MAPQTIDWPAIDAVEVFGLDAAQPQTITWPVIDAGVMFPPMVLTEAAQTAGLEVLVDGTVVDGTFARSWDDQLADTGSFSFQMLRSDFLTAPVGFDAEVTFRLDGVPTFLGIVKGIDHTALAKGEAADQVVTIKGPGMLADFARQVVYPSRGLGALPIEDTRSLSWVSVDFSATGAGWPLAKVVNYQRSYADTDAPRPTIFPNIAGMWIWGNVAGVNSLDAPQGINLFRQVFTLAATKTVRFFFAGDNVMRLWVDAAEMTWFAGSAVGRYVDVELSAGGHVIAAKVANKVDVPGEYNPAGFILAAYTLTSDGLLDDLIVETDTDWRVLPYPVRAPGFTDGRAMRVLGDEGGMWDTWGRSFTDTKTTKGTAWTYQREIAVGVGRTLLDYQRERMDAYADIACAPGAKVLRMWNRGERGIVRAVTLQQTADPETSDFLALSHQGKSTRADQMLVRYADGHTESGSGDVVAYLELGVVESESEAEITADALMENRAAPSFSTSATLVPRTDATTPYKGFEVGDWITVPNEDNDPELMRVNSIAYTEDQDGVVEWAVTLRDFALSVEERHDAWLRRMADGTAVGGARVSSRKDTPAPSAQQISVLKVAEFSYDNTALTTGRWPTRPAEESGNVIEVYGQLTTAGSTSTVVSVVVDGNVIATLTFAAGQTEVSEPVGIVPARADVSKAYIDCTTAGTAAKGLVVQIRAI